MSHAVSHADKARKGELDAEIKHGCAQAGMFLAKIPDFWSNNTTKLRGHGVREDLLTSELQPSQLKRHQAVADLDEMDESVQVVRGQDEAVSGAEVAPSAQQEVSTQAVLQGAGEVFVEDRVQVVVVRA